ncbi:glycosyltransferase, group 1 family protein [delta proteobacterium NaphS2]|nr:glycosyltransferase, group 1 family protein [delta proteobacterium NaphS2]
MKSLDVIIVNYNSTPQLLQCVSSLLSVREGISLNIHVQDNASPKGDLSAVKRDFPEVLLIRNDRNLGFAKAVNRAIKNGTAPYVLILNPDTLVLPGLLDVSLGYMENHPEVGVLGPRILDSDGVIQGSARSFPNLLTALFGRRSFLSKILPHNPITRENILTAQSDGMNPMEVDWVSGAGMLVRRDAINDVGPLDERFFMYWEDADWCRRMWRKGWKVIYFPEAAMIHHVGVSSESNIFRSVLEFHRSIYRLFDKHAEGWNRYLKPLVFWGLLYRFIFIFLSQLARKKLVQTEPFPVGKKEPIKLRPEDFRIRIIRFIARLNVGGPSIHVYLLTTGLDSKRFHSSLVTGRISPREGDMRYLFESAAEQPLIIEALQRDISPLMDTKAFLHILRLLRHERPHIVHTHTAKAGTTARLAAIIYNYLFNGNAHTVHTFHGHVFSGYFSRTKSLMIVWVERLLAQKTDVIVAISQTQKRDLVHKFHIAPSDRIKVIPLGFDLTPFLNSHQNRGVFRKSMGVEDRTLLVGIVGRLVPIKNHMLFLNMAEIFLNENPHLNVKFIVIGDGELRKMLVDYVERRRLVNHVEFCGWRRDLPQVYADLQILALTSKNEGTPVSIIEAMASGTPVISTDAGGVSDLLGFPKKDLPEMEGFTVCKRGILCHNDDAVGFAQGLDCLISMDISQRDQMVDEAREFVLRTFSNERLLHDMEKLYLKIAKFPPVKAL